MNKFSYIEKRNIQDVKKIDFVEDFWGDITHRFLYRWSDR